MLTLDLSELKYDKSTKMLHYVLGSASYPDAVEIVSNYTGQVIRFEQDKHTAIQNEFWDGELMEYLPTETCNVSRLRILPYS